MSASTADAFPRRLARRLVTIPSLLLATAAYTLTSPLALLFAAATDFVGKGLRLRPTLRIAGLVQGFLIIETAGITALGTVFLCAPFAGPRRERLTYWVQRLYIRAHVAWVSWIFALHFQVDGDAIPPGLSWVILARHSSLLDVILPGYFLGHLHDLRLRYVLKRELLLEPCLDVAGHFLPNHFVTRGGADTAREVEAIRALKRTLGPGDSVLIYPEGTHFSPSKRQRALERSSGEAHARAAALRHLLPCRSGGPMALLEAPPNADLVFFGHHGFEGLSSLQSLRSGSLVGRTVHIRLWHEPASNIPRGDGERGQAERAAWLGACWQRIDDWLDTFPT